MRTGWPPGLLQDDDRGLSKWFASKPDARRLVRERCKEIESEHMNQHTEPEPTTDRELLELAAKAAGYRLEWDGSPDKWQPMYYEGKTYQQFDPLTDDGDALRLAVKLGIKVEFFHSSNTAFAGPLDMACAEEEVDGDSCAATRRAIVRAAAEIGKTMPCA